MMNKSTYNKNYRSSLIKSGICPRCCNKKLSNNYKHCEECRKALRIAEEARRRSKGIQPRRKLREYIAGESAGNYTLIKIVKHESNKELRKHEKYWRVRRNNHWLCTCKNCGRETILKERSFAKLKRSGGGCNYCSQLSRGEAGLNRLYYGYKNKAEKRNLVFELTSDEFSKLTKINCEYCGCKPEKTMKVYNDNSTWGEYIYNGIDRKNSLLGYTPSNCVSCCTECNLFKRRHSYERWMNFLKRIRKSCSII